MNIGDRAHFKGEDAEKSALGLGKSADMTA